MAKKVPKKHIKESRRVVRVLTNIKRRGSWTKSSDLAIVNILVERNYIKYSGGKKNKLFSLTKKGESYLKEFKKLKIK